MRSARLYALLNVIARVALVFSIAGWLGIFLALVTR
jgi:hypothetical protein